MATDLVANLDGTALDLEAKLLDLALEQVVEDVSLRDLAKLGMTMLVVGEVDAAVADLLVGEAVEDTLADHGGAVVDAHQLALDDAGDHHVDDFVDGNLGLVEELGDDDHGVVAGAGDTEGQVAGRAAHGADHEPVLAGAGVLHDGGGQHAALGLGAVVAEGGAGVGQRQVVVDGLGNVDVGDGIVLVGQELGDAVGGGSGVVAADGDEELDLVVGEELEVEALLEVLGRGFEAAHFEDAATLVEYLVGGEEVEVLHAGLVGEEGTVAAVETDDAETVAEEGLGHRGHHCIHSRGGTAARKYCYAFHVGVFMY